MYIYAIFCIFAAEIIKTLTTMRKIDSFKIIAGFRLVSAVTIAALTVMGMLFSNSFYGCLSVLLIGSALLVLVDTYLSK